MDHQVTLTAKGERWHRSGHPWVYKDDIKEVDSALSGQVVRVKAPNGRPVGQAFYNAGSKITLRWLDADPEKPIDQGFWGERLRAAVALRERVVRESTAYRLISSEADGFPGFIVDRYAEVLVLQVLSLGIDRILPLLIELLTGELHPQAIVARNDSHIRTLEGLPLEKRVLTGTLPDRIEVKEGSVRTLVDVLEGQKTGAYLDQRENRLWAGNLRGLGRVLDAFSYQGGFALHLAPHAQEVLCIEDSELAIGRLKENVELNRIRNVRVERDNAFDRLKSLGQAEEKFDLIVLDPPAFAKAKAEIPGAWRGYREINLRAMHLLKPGGMLITCSCSYNMSEEDFVSILREASSDAHRSARLMESRTQSRDHPILLTHPESKYLKCVILEIL